MFDKEIKKFNVEFSKFLTRLRNTDDYVSILSLMGLLAGLISFELDILTGKFGSDDKDDESHWEEQDSMTSRRFLSPWV